MKRKSTLFKENLITNGDRTPDEPRQSPAEFSPSERVIRNILNYSKSLFILKSYTAGHANLVMN